MSAYGQLCRRRAVKFAGRSQAETGQIAALGGVLRVSTIFEPATGAGFQLRERIDGSIPAASTTLYFLGYLFLLTIRDARWQRQASISVGVGTDADDCECQSSRYGKSDHVLRTYQLDIGKQSIRFVNSRAKSGNNRR